MHAELAHVHERLWVTSTALELEKARVNYAIERVQLLSGSTMILLG